MIIKRNFNPIKVIQYVKIELLFSILLSSTIYILHISNMGFPAIPFSISVILGGALAVFIAFRNNSSYSRWWEARNAWATIQSSCRNFARQLIANSEIAIINGKKSIVDVEKFRMDLINRQIAYIHALRISLRKETNNELLSKYLIVEELNQYENCYNVPNKLLLNQTKQIKLGINNEFLGAFDNISLEPVLMAISNSQALCEKIKNTPLQRHYDYFARVFLYIFIVIFPMSLNTDLLKMNVDYLLIPISTIIAFVYATIGKVGEVNEDPFENKINDVPLNRICHEIEADLMDLCNKKDFKYLYKLEVDYVF